MNKTELKYFAIQARRQLIDKVKTKALMYGIDEKNDLEIQEQFGQLMINDKQYPLYMKPAFNSLKNQLKQKGYKQLVEEVAYTWFNRIIAIRYMEVHDYLPEKVNVLSSSVGRVDPDILFEYETMDLPVKQEEIRELLHAGDTEGAYRQLFIAQCNALSSILSFLFEKIQDYSELLLPDFLLDAESVIKKLVRNDELNNSFEEIEVIGWLYQYYIAEEKDRVFAQKSKYKKEEIPFATQLFTPKWIVQYMVQNSLGRYWTESHREDEDLISNWGYFIKHEEEDFHEKIAPYVNKELRVEDIKLLDPAMGSGHILVYAFEVFHQIYEKCGYPERDIPRLIIENNLYGLDIDDRAYQLAAFAVVMKASSYSRRFLRNVEREGIQLNLASIEETNHISNDVIAYIAQEEKGNQYNQVKNFFNQYYNAKTYGSLINVTERDLTFIEERFEHIQNNPVEDLFFAEQHNTAKEVLPALVKQTKIMRNEYDVVVMNPPYMGKGSMNEEISTFLKNSYPDSKTDLFTAFMEINHYLKKESLYAAINQHSWMFSSSYQKLRLKIINNKNIDSMLHIGPRAFEEIGGEVVQSTTFVLRNFFLNSKGLYFRLVDISNKNSKEKTFLNIKENKEKNFYLSSQTNFLDLPNNPIAYWCTEKVYSIFLNEKELSKYAIPRVGLQTGDNERFLRLWHEVELPKLGFGSSNAEDAVSSNKKWFPYHKGGEFKKWFGNNYYIVNWENNGEEIKEFGHYLNSIKKPSSRMGIANSEEFYFMEGLTWSSLTTGSISFRYSYPGFLFDTKGPICIIKEKVNLYYLLGLLNSKVSQLFLNFLSPTLDYNPGAVSKLPIIVEKSDEIEIAVIENVKITKENWDSYEISWGFSKHPLLTSDESYLSESFNQWSNKTKEDLNKLQSNEENINEFFIRIYGLYDELDSVIEEKNTSIKLANLETDIRAFLSYFIGCLTGRYSLDSEGLSYAGGEWDDSKYSSFRPTPNGIIHFTESTYFGDDIILRLREFLKLAFSPDTVNENLQWLAEALEMKKGEDAEARIRRYFLDEFFTDHCKLYQKRPIYWLVDSGKQKGLRTLIYMQRYQPETMATIRFEHLQEIQAKYQNEITDLENRLVNPNLSASEKKKLTAEKTSFEKKMDELREFDKRLAEIANEEIEIDLDDGVKVNHEKLYRGGKGVLAKIK
ncbi:BREX-1 system adenine-specific DNA-methyltransferase PglX [Peribacillus saganii]|uniref:site-specific DNA-methyltransferase (adenine-specific) n=1 Tax=Peribacillus saganii TaxID=2303992 RepID=A0A372LKZ7_9BACI|nr:BREX-1 system adenine-specific DNA-methyltransferase PglX [Peribacillus saganii]RFU67467.1 BREX-1 system adenine-specific DNA-methyltransferase PglX [Peribacillus saganii]